MADRQSYAPQEPLPTRSLSLRPVRAILVFLLLVLASGAFLDLIKDGGAREQGLANRVAYDGWLNSLPIVWGACVSLYLLIRFTRQRFNARHFRRLPHQAILLVCLIATAGAEYPKAAVAAFLLLLCSVLLVADHAHAITIRAFSVWLTSFSLLIGLASLAFVAVLPSYGISVGSENDGLWQGVFSHKNSLGGFAALGVLAATWSLWHVRVDRFLNVLALAVSGLLLYGSGSLTAQIAALLSSFVVIGLGSGLGVLLWRCRVLILVFALCLGLVLVLYVSGISDDSGDKFATFSSRNLIWVYILQRLQDRTFFGYGLEQLAQLNSLGDDFSVAVGFSVASAHNGFLETAFAVGLSGLFCLIITMILDLKSARRTPAGAFLFATTIAFVVVNLFESKALSWNMYYLLLVYGSALSKGAE